MKFPEYKQIVNLIPGGCPQFLDFGIKEDQLKRYARSFCEDASETEGGKYPHFLRCLTQDVQDNNTSDLVDMREAIGTQELTLRTKAPTPFIEDYSVPLLESLQCFCAEWMPLPFLRVTGQTWPDGAGRVEKGPSNWARGMMLPVEEIPGLWHLTIVFDTKIEEKPENEDGRYFALSQDDLNAASEFLLAWHVRDNSWFVNEGWVDQWIHDRYEAWLKNRLRFVRSTDENSCLRHLAYYMTWLDVASRAMGPVRVKVSDSNRSDAIDVDLILDIGNSRTTGILVETSAAKKTDLNDSYLLELRDLSDPNRICTDPFETRVEFVDVSFGNDLLSRRSGRRTPAFAWPSCVRVGPEATRLSTYASCAEGNTGMSSPKRYLWDENKWTQSWRYNTCGGQEPLVTRGLFPRQLNEYGTPIFCFEGRERNRWLTSPAIRKQPAEPLFGSFFTRSSLMMFMVGEIVTQALVNINSPDSRGRRLLSDKPRHLRRIIFTVPTAMPVAERRIFQRWVELAVRLIWHGLGWDQGKEEKGFHYQELPAIICEWDEASCSHLVLLYNEIMVKHLGDAGRYFSLYGRLRKGSDGINHPSVRIASIDIGGGTTDLSITTHVLVSDPSESPRIEPHMEFRDGFNIAGDEVLREVIRNRIIPAIEKVIESKHLESRSVTLSLFGRYTQAKTEQLRTRQAQFVRQFAVPVALGILQACENLDPDDGQIYTCNFGDFFSESGELGNTCSTSKQTPLLNKNKKNSEGKEYTAASSCTGPSTENGTPEEAGITKAKDSEEISEKTGLEGATSFTPHTKAPRPQAGVLRFFDTVINNCGGKLPIDIMTIPLTFSLELISEDIRRVLGDTLSSLCEMVHLYDSDILLVTGRPSAWKGVLQTILAKTPLTPDRVIAMRNYHVGSWYPCADIFGCIADPKSTVVVGAILCALSCGYLEGINFDASRMRMTSTARYVGELNMQGQLEKNRVWFIANDDGSIEPEEREITYHSPITIGYRQLAAERWPASRYYKLDFVNKAEAGSGPYRVKLQLKKDSGLPLNFDSEMPQGEGEIIIDEISQISPSGDAQPLRAESMTATLQTLPSLDGYWLDSGIVISEG